MNKPLEYDGHHYGNTLSRASEVHDLAVDSQHLGSTALASEIQAAHLTGAELTAILPNPLADYREKRARGEDKDHHNLVVEALGHANGTLVELQANLVGQESTIPPEGSGIGMLRQLHKQEDGNDNREMILEGADMPPFLRATKAMTAVEKDQDPHAYPWIEWFKDASNEQLTNFSQWYTQRLTILANPESKAQFVESLKNNYSSRVLGAMREGWIDTRHARALKRAVKRSELRFFSPFGDMPTNQGGASRFDEHGGRILELPTIAGDGLVTHEFEHTFTGLDIESMRKYFAQKLGKQEVDRLNRTINHFGFILNEGFNEHITAALINGAPEIMSPRERAAQGIPEVAGASTRYTDYRELDSVLLGGSEKRTDRPAIKQLMNVLVDKNFNVFDKLIARRWPRRNVLTELLKVVDIHDTERVAQGDNTFDTDSELVTKMIACLQKTALAA